MKSVILENYFRISVLSEDVVRIEFDRKGKFEDRNTFFVPHRDLYEGALYQVEERQDETIICVSQWKIHVKKGIASLKAISVEGDEVYPYKKTENTGELPKVEKTPEFYFFMDSPQMILPKHGYSKESIERGEQYEINENAQDLYILKCDKDHRKLRSLYVELTGRNELVSLSVLGSWNSKYFVYCEDTAKELIETYEAKKVPLDYMVIDTDWREVTSHNGMGYDINTELFPDMRRFLNFAHDHHVNIIFNDHPEPVKEAVNCLDPKEISYREEKLKSLLSLGLDAWWYDRNWITKLISPTSKIAPETMGMYIFNDVTRTHHESLSKSDKNILRDDMMSNINEIENGRYDHIKDSASHRYGVEWTGDIESTESALRQEVASLIKCSNSCIPYASADIGGHIGNPDKDLYIRWMMFGAFSPIMRPHCTNCVAKFREPWNYDEETVDIVRAYLDMRYHLLPLYYARAYQSYLNGEAIFTSLSYQYPDDAKTYDIEDSYMLGKDILISPTTSLDYRRIHRNNYVGKVHVDYYHGKDFEGDIIASEELDCIDLHIEDREDRTAHKDVSKTNFCARYQFKLRFGNDVILMPSNDDGIRVFVDGKLLYEDWNCHAPTPVYAGVITGGVTHEIVIEYFQAEGRQVLELYVAKNMKEGTRSIYLPKGEWISVFDGKIYQGNKTIHRGFDNNKLPLFVRLGSLIPLAKTAQNTKVQNWDRLVYDYYPSKEARDDFFLYEDDTMTKNYQKGEFRVSNYHASFDAEDNAFVIQLEKENGTFKGKKCFKERKVALRYHFLPGVENIKEVTVNGEAVEFKIRAKDKKAYPFGFESKRTPDTKVMLVNFVQDTSLDYEIKVYLK